MTTNVNCEVVNNVTTKTITSSHIRDFKRVEECSQ